MRIRRPSGLEVLSVLREVGFKDYITSYVVTPFTVTGESKLKGVWHLLRKDPRFLEGKAHGLHVDVGKRRTDFRSKKGSVCKGSLQLVIDLDTGRFYSDIDAWNIYQGLIHIFGHTVFEVALPHVRGKEEIAVCQFCEQDIIDESAMDHLRRLHPEVVQQMQELLDEQRTPETPEPQGAESKDQQKP